MKYILVDKSTNSLRARAYIDYAIVNNIVNYERNPVVYEEIIKIVKKYTSLYTLSTLKDHYMIKVYRNYLWRLGIDPTKTRPSHEALIRRILRYKSFPLINAVVDTGNYVSVKYFVPIGIYDVDKITWPVTIRVSRTGDIFHPIGSEDARDIPEGYPVLADPEKVIHVFPHRDSRLSMISIDTKNILLIVAGVEGVPITTVRKALNELIDYIVQYLGTSNTRIVRGKVIWFGRV